MDKPNTVDGDFKLALGVGVGVGLIVGGVASMIYYDRKPDSTPTLGDYLSFAAGTSFLVAFVGFWVIVIALSFLPSRRAATRAATEQRAVQQREAAQAREQDEEARRQQRRRDQLNGVPIGSKEWKSIRFKHHIFDVHRATGVRWEAYMWKSAHAAQLSARNMMNELLATDRELIREAKIATANRRMTPTERTLGITSWQASERFAADWMRRHYSGVTLTGAGQDGGIDVRADGVVAQVKWIAKRVDRPAVQRLKGASGGDDCLFFAVQGYTPHAVEWADEYDVALLAIDADGHVTPCNQVAIDLIEQADARGAVVRRRQPTLGRDGMIDAFASWLASHRLAPIELAPEQGIDLWTSRLAVKVCWSPTNLVGRPSLDQIAAAARERRPILVVSVPRGLSPAATKHAHELRLPVFGVNAGPEVTPLNIHAEGIVEALRMRDR